MDFRNILKHILGDSSYPAQRGLAGEARRLLKSRLDGVDWGIAQRAHGAGNETNDSSLVAGDGRGLVLGLPVLKDFFEFGVGGEIYSLVGSYSI